MFLRVKKEKHIAALVKEIRIKHLRASIKTLLPAGSNLGNLLNSTTVFVKQDGYCFENQF